ncbi:MAG: protein kinase [Bacteroidetes bacterium]|nr:protein kinase [Bacteroidota bacterium]
MHLPANTILNNKQYRIKKVIGQGGFGITYLAEEIGYYRQTGYSDKPEYVEAKAPDTVVIKELYYNDYCQRDLKTGLVNISNTEKRIEFSKLVENQLDEGKKLRSLNHPNIVRTRDIFKENGTAYMVMDYVESTDLEELLIKAGKIEKPKALKYINQVLSALIHIHDRKKLHLDITPSNVLISKDKDAAILIDFGVSQSYDDTGKIIGRTSQLIIGMKKYYAPNEQGDIDNLKTFDATFDTYAAGATLYHLLTGQKPPLSSLLSTGREKLIPPSTFVNNNGVSDYLDAVLAKSLAPMFHERFKSAAEFEGALVKETEYIKQVSEIGKLIASKNFQLAVNKIETTETNYLPTKSLADYKKIANTELNKDRLKIEFENHFSKGVEWQNNKEYSKAIREFEKALEIQPDNVEVKTNLNHCTQQLTEINKLKEIDGLLIEGKAFISNNHYEAAKNTFNSILSIDPNHVEAISLLKAIQEKEQERHTKALAELIIAFNNEDYHKAIGLKQSINLQTLSKKDLAIIYLLNQDNVLQYNNAANELNTIDTQLNKLNYNYEDFDIKLQNIADDYKSLSQKIDRLNLPHNKLNTFKITIEKTLKTKQEATVVIRPSKNTTSETILIPSEQEKIIPKRNKEKYIYRGILAAIVAALAFLYFREKSNSVKEQPIIVSTDSLPAMVADTSIINTSPSKLNDTGTSLSTISKTDALKNDNKWKTEFKNRFNEIKNKESTSSVDELFNLYQGLYGSLPKSAANEKEQVKQKMDYWGSKFIDQSKLAESERKSRMEAQAQSLVNDANNAFKSNLYQLAAEKYSKANSIVQGSGDVGYYKFLEKAKELYDKIDPCAPPYLNRLREAKSIKNTSEVNNLLNKCN